MQRFLQQIPTLEVILAVIFRAFFAFFKLSAEKFPFLIFCCFYFYGVCTTKIKEIR